MTTENITVYSKCLDKEADCETATWVFDIDATYTILCKYVCLTYFTFHLSADKCKLLHVSLDYLLSILAYSCEEKANISDMFIHEYERQINSSSIS